MLPLDMLIGAIEGCDVVTARRVAVHLGNSALVLPWYASLWLRA